MGNPWKPSKKHKKNLVIVQTEVKKTSGMKTQEYDKQLRPVNENCSPKSTRTRILSSKLAYASKHNSDMVNLKPLQESNVDVQLGLSPLQLEINYLHIPTKVCPKLHLSRAQHLKILNQWLKTELTMVCLRNNQTKWSRMGLP